MLAVGGRVDARGRAEVRTRVEAVAQRVGYRPNRLAQALVAGHTQALGVLLPPPNGNAYFLGVIESIYTSTREFGYDALISFTPVPESGDFGEAVHALEARQVEGLIAYSLGGQFEDHERTHGPVSFPVIHLSAEPHQSASVVTIDEIAGGYQATRHLTDLDHRKIACLCPEAYVDPWQLREHGYLRAMEEVGEEPIFFGTSPTSGADARTACSEMLEQRPDVTAIFARNDLVALGVLSALNDVGIRVPKVTSPH